MVDPRIGIQRKKCLNYIDMVFSALLKGKIDRVNYKETVKFCLLNFEVSQSTIEKFINDFYLETPDFVIENGIIKKNPQNEQQF